MTKKKYICNRPLAPNNLHGKMHKHKTTRGWRGERLGHSQDNKRVIYFYLIRRTLHIEQAGRDEGEAETSNKEGDLYGGGSPLSHVILWELAGALRSYFLTEKRQQIHPSTSPQTMAPALPFCLTPVYYHTLRFCTHSTLFCFSRRCLMFIQKGSRDDL